MKYTSSHTSAVGLCSSTLLRRRGRRLLTTDKERFRHNMWLWLRSVCMVMRSLPPCYRSVCNSCRWMENSFCLFLQKLSVCSALLSSALSLGTRAAGSSCVGWGGPAPPRPHHKTATQRWAARHIYVLLVSGLEEFSRSNSGSGAHLEFGGLCFQEMRQKHSSSFIMRLFVLFSFWCP